MNTEEKSFGIIVVIAVIIIALSIIDAWKDNTRIRSKLSAEENCLADDGRWYEIIKRCG